MRLFVALEIPGEIRNRLRDLIAELRPICQDARWATPEQMHVTLKFIGHAIDRPENENFAALRAALRGIQSPAPVDLQFRGLGFFPNSRHPRVFWCGIEASENLARLAVEIGEALEPLGIPAETRDYKPHLTLARFKMPQPVPRLAHLAEQNAAREFGSVHTAEFHLFESITKPSGAEYRNLESFKFVKARG
jgi:RNA 2',3'-cyclic 3'-phosphodiesterase